MKNVYEIIEEFQEIPTDKAERIDILRQHGDHNGFMGWLMCIFNPQVEFVDMEIPEWKEEPMPPGMGYSTFYTEFKRVYLYIKNHPNCPAGLTNKRRTELLLQSLESMEPKESEMWVRMMRKKADVPYLTRNLVKEAFPHLNLGEDANETQRDTGT